MTNWHRWNRQCETDNVKQTYTITSMWDARKTFAKQFSYFGKTKFLEPAHQNHMQSADSEARLGQSYTMWHRYDTYFMTMCRSFICAGYLIAVHCISEHTVADNVLHFCVQSGRTWMWRVHDVHFSSWLQAMPDASNTSPHHPHHPQHHNYQHNLQRYHVYTCEKSKEIVQYNFTIFSHLIQSLKVWKDLKFLKRHECWWFHNYK